MSQLMHQQALCAALEIIINQALAFNIHGTKALVPLEQKTLTLELNELGFPLSFTVNASKILVTTLEDTDEEDASCIIKTSIATLRELRREQQLTELIKQDKLDISGNIKIAQQFAAIAETLEIDWQSEIEKHIGDVATYKLGRLSNAVKEKLAFAARQIQADASEWLVHEKRLVVTESQINDFNQQVDQVSKQTDAMAKRIERLSQKLLTTDSSKG